MSQGGAGIAQEGRAAMERGLAWARRNPLVPLLIGSAALVAILAALLLWAEGPDYRVLYSNLSDGDGGRIITELEQRGIPYQFAQGGHALLVPADKVYNLRLKLAEKGLPQSGNVGFEIMDKEAFGISQFAEHVNYQRGLQGELASSIEVLQPVAQARVHLALPKESLFVRDQQPAKATVVLTLRPGRTLGNGQVNAIVHMVASSVRDLAPDNVTVVDQNGHLLSRNGSTAGLDGSQLDYVREVEDRYRRRIENILTPILGAGNVHAQVTAQVDFSRREETSEHYQPNQGDQPAAVRSRQTSLSWNGDAKMLGGIPGALSNTPPGVAASPINDTDKDKKKGKKTSNDDEQQQKGDLHRANTTNYEVDHNIIHTQHQLGSLQRLSVAVVVNYHDVKQADGSVKQEPLDDKTMQQITELARQAMGFSAQRGDGLEVVNSAFREAPSTALENSWWQTVNWTHLLLILGRYLLVLIAGLVLYRVLLRPLLHRYLNSPRQVVVAPPPEPAPDAAEDPPPPPPRRTRKASTYEHNLRDLKERATEDPAMVAMIVRSWMKNDD